MPSKTFIARLRAALPRELCPVTPGPVSSGPAPAGRTKRAGISGWLLCAVLLSALFSTAALPPRAAQAQTAPAMINFQGRLTDSLNNPLEGSHGRMT